MKEAIEEERDQNKEVVRALELLQAKFEALQVCVCVRVRACLCSVCVCVLLSVVVHA